MRKNPSHKNIHEEEKTTLTVSDSEMDARATEAAKAAINKVVKQQQLVPIKEGVKGNLYLKGNVLKNKW